MKRVQVTQFIIAGLIILILLINGNVNADKKECEKAVDLAKQGVKNNIKNYETAHALETVKLPSKFRSDIIEPLSKRFPEIDSKKSVIKLKQNIDGSFTLDINLKNINGEDITTMFGGDLPSGYKRTFRWDEKGDLIIKNENLVINPKFREKGIGDGIYDFEDELYKKMGAKQVRVTAVLDGRSKWAKEKYGFKFAEPEKVSIEFNNWLKTEDGKKWLSSTSLASKNLGNNPHLYPKQFLKSLGSIEYIKKY